MICVKLDLVTFVFLFTDGIFMAGQCGYDLGEDYIWRKVVKDEEEIHLHCLVSFMMMNGY